MPETPTCTATLTTQLGAGAVGQLACSLAAGHYTGPTPDEPQRGPSGSWHVGRPGHGWADTAPGATPHREPVGTPSDGFDIPAFVVMSERKTELAYKGVHTREAAESLAGGFDDVGVRGAEDVIRELCEQVARAEATSPAPDGEDLAAVLDRLLAVANDLIHDTTDPGTEALAAVWCAQQALGRTPESEGGGRVGETECGTCGETVDVYMAPVTEAHEWGPDDGPGSENPPTLCPGSQVDHGDVARLDALRGTPAASVATPPEEGEDWVTRAAGPPEIDLDYQDDEGPAAPPAEGDAATGERAGLDRALYVLADVVSRFTEKGHPGRPALRTSWQNTEHVDWWRSELAALRNASPAVQPGEPYLHTLRCVKDACTEDCPRRHERAEDGSGDRRVDFLADALEMAYRAGRNKSDEEVSARDLLAQLDALRAAPTVEILTAAEVQALPRGSWFVPVDDGGVPLHDGDGPARAHPSANFYRPKNTPTPDRHAIVYRAPEPEPVAPLAVGDTVKTVDQLDTLPHGSLIRAGAGGVIEKMWPGAYAWVQTGNDERFRPQAAWLPARLLDLPTVGSS